MRHSDGHGDAYKHPYIHFDKDPDSHLYRDFHGYAVADLYKHPHANFDIYGIKHIDIH